MDSSFGSLKNPHDYILLSLSTKREVRQNFFAKANVKWILFAKKHSLGLARNLLYWKCSTYKKEPYKTILIEKVNDCKYCSAVVKDWIIKSE